MTPDAMWNTIKEHPMEFKAAVKALPNTKEFLDKMTEIEEEFVESVDLEGDDGGEGITLDGSWNGLSDD